jgi:hypothetical protein
VIESAITGRIMEVPSSGKVVSSFGVVEEVKVLLGMKD